MRDVIALRRSALTGSALPNLSGTVVVHEVGPRVRFIYRGAPENLGTAFGPTLPVEPCHSATMNMRSALWLGPDEWLLLADDGDAQPELETLCHGIDGARGCLVDVGHRNVGVGLIGPRAADVLGSACPLDFDLGSFPVGMCTRTLFGKAEVIMWRTATDRFHLEVWRSFAPYVAALLTQVARDLPTV